MGTRVLCSDGKRKLCSDGKRKKVCTYRQARVCGPETLANVWMTPIDAATFPNAFSITATGVCYFFDFSDPLGTPGTIYAAADATAYADCDTCNNDGPAPCDCPDPSILHSSYAIVGYSNGYFATPCTQCSNDNDPTFGGGTLAAWDGVFQALSGCNYAVFCCEAVNGKALDQGENTRILGPSGPPNCFWALAVWCGDWITNIPYLVWSGTKTTGNTPAGTYTRTGGCDMRGTVVVA